MSNVPSMKTESMGRITWFANSRAMLEPRFRSLEESLWGTPGREPVHAKSSEPNGSKSPGHVPHSHFRDEGGETNPGVIVVPIDFSPASLDAVDRKSTRLNSSHLGISYAVFC